MNICLAAVPLQVILEKHICQSVLSWIHLNSSLGLSDYDVPLVLRPFSN